MAVGPTEGLSANFMRIDERQITIASKAISVMNAIMRAAETTPVSPNGSLQKRVAGVTDTGVGVFVDLTG